MKFRRRAIFAFSLSHCRLLLQRATFLHFLFSYFCCSNGKHYYWLLWVDAECDAWSNLLLEWVSLTSSHAHTNTRRHILRVWLMMCEWECIANCVRANVRWRQHVCLNVWRWIDGTDRFAAANAAQSFQYWLYCIRVGLAAIWCCHSYANTAIWFNASSSRSREHALLSFSLHLDHQIY